MEDVIEIKYKDQLLAIIIPHSFGESGVHFYTGNDFSQQLAYMGHPVGKTIEPHTHNPVERRVMHTQEVLFVRKGKLRVDFYNDDRKYIESRVLVSGDTILLASGGHGFRVLEELEMIEVKQGPYSGDADKTRFDAVAENKIKVIPVDQTIE